MIQQGSQKNLNSSTSFRQAAVTLLTQGNFLFVLGGIHKELALCSQGAVQQFRTVHTELLNRCFLRQSK